MNQDTLDLQSRRYINRYYVFTFEDKFIKDVEEWDYINCPASDGPIDEYNEYVKDTILTEEIQSAERFYLSNTKETNVYSLPKYTLPLHDSVVSDTKPNRWMSLDEMKEYYNKLLGTDSVKYIKISQINVTYYTIDSQNDSEL